METRIINKNKVLPETQVKNLEDTLNDKLKKAVLKQKSFERKEYLYKRKERQSYRIGDMIASLDKFRAEQDKASFVNMFKNAIPNIKKYIIRRIAQAQITTAINPKAFNYQELSP